jgi:hypothetical protein
MKPSELLQTWVKNPGNTFKMKCLETAGVYYQIEVVVDENHKFHFTKKYITRNGEKILHHSINLKWDDVRAKVSGEKIDYFYFE